MLSFHLLGVLPPLLLFIDAKFCPDAFSCASQNISEINSSIECYGSSSCTKAPLIESKTQGWIQCYGSFSCYKASIIQHTDTGSTSYPRGIFCYGLYSCSMVDYLYQKTGDVYCDGERACYQSNIIIIAGNFVCYSERGCSDAIITGGSFNFLYGHLAAENTIFNTNSDVATYYFYGTSSGKNSTVICGDGHTCYIECYNNACNELTLRCNNITSNNCTFITDCRYAEKSDICPGGYSHSDVLLLTGNIYNMPELYDDYNYSHDINITTINNSKMYCNESGVINCDDYLECVSSSMLNSAPVCCTAIYGCQSAFNISSDIDAVAAITINDNVAIRCDGYFSCDDISGIIVAENGGNIYAAGRRAAKGSGIIQSTIDYDIFCVANEGCHGKTIRYARNLFCNGRDACQDAVLIELINNVFVYGYDGAERAIISDIYENVYCGAYEACRDSVIRNIGNDVYGGGYEALYNATIENVTNSLIAFGIDVLYQATVINVTNVCFLHIFLRVVKVFLFFCLLFFF